MTKKRWAEELQQGSIAAKVLFPDSARPRINSAGRLRCGWAGVLGFGHIG